MYSVVWNISFDVVGGITIHLKSSNFVFVRYRNLPLMIIITLTMKIIVMADWKFFWRCLRKKFSTY